MLLGTVHRGRPQRAEQHQHATRVTVRQEPRRTVSAMPARDVPSSFWLVELCTGYVHCCLTGSASTAPDVKF